MEKDLILEVSSILKYSSAFWYSYIFNKLPDDFDSGAISALTLDIDIDIDPQWMMLHWII